MKITPEPRKFLVTGATGFVGKHLVRGLLLRHGPESLVALVHPRRRASENGAYEFMKRLDVAMLEVDLLDLPRLSPPAPTFDAVIHLAAAADPENPATDYSVNDAGTRLLVGWLGPALRGRRFIYASTLACVDCDVPTSPITEATPCTPRTPYGVTKLRAEEIIRIASSEIGFEHTILRLCTVIGSGFRPAGMFGRCADLLARKSMATRLNWPGRSSYLCVDDLVRILLELTTTAGSVNQTFVVSNGEDPSFDEMLALVARTLEVDRSRVALPGWFWRGLGSVAWAALRSRWCPESVRTTAWRVAHIARGGIWADATKLNRLLGMRYKSIADSLRDAYGRTT